MNETTLKIFNRTIQIKKQWKITFLATWIGGMLAHAYRFFIFLPSWDSMYNFAGTGATYSSGRCFLEFFRKISSKSHISVLYSIRTCYSYINNYIIINNSILI